MLVKSTPRMRVIIYRWNFKKKCIDNGEIERYKDDPYVKNSNGQKIEV